jgi:hypothetical protein
MGIADYGTITDADIANGASLALGILAVSPIGWWVLPIGVASVAVSLYATSLENQHNH